MSGFIDLTGQRFGKLLVIEKSHTSYRGTVIWTCQCDCGTTAYMRSDRLRNGSAKSCGCMSSRNRTAGQFARYNNKESITKREAARLAANERQRIQRAEEKAKPYGQGTLTHNGRIYIDAFLYRQKPPTIEKEIGLWV